MSTELVVCFIWYNTHIHCASADVLPQFTSTHIKSDSTVSSGGGGATDGTSKCFPDYIDDAIARGWACFSGGMF